MSEEENENKAIESKSSVKTGKTIMSTLIGSIEPFLAGGDFEEYEMRLAQYIIVNDIPENKKVPLFITCIGADAYSILRRMLAPDDPSTKTYGDLVKALKSYFDPSKSEISETYKFYQIEQGESSTVDFIMKLKSQAQKCNFGTHLQRALRDKFVCGIRDGHLRAKFLKEQSLTFEAACKTAISWEMAEKENTSLDQKSETSNAFMVRQSRSHSRSKSKSKSRNPKNESSTSRKKSCYRCGKQHSAKTCAARFWKCYRCQKLGHLAAVCLSTKGSKQESQASSDNETVAQLAVGASNLNKIDAEDEILNIHKINNTATVSVIVENQHIEMEVDTGACTSVITEDEYSAKFSHVKLIPNKTLYFSVTGSSIQCVGKIMVKVNYKHILEFIVIKSDKKFKPIIGRTWLDIIYPDWRQSFKNICKMYFGVCVTILVTASWVGATHCIKFLYLNRTTYTTIADPLDGGEKYEDNATLFHVSKTRMATAGFSAPFFASWFCTNFAFLFFPIYLLGRIAVRKCDKPQEILGDVLRGFRDRGFTYGRFLNRCLSFCFLWVLTTYLYALSLRALYATDVMALFATNVACVYLLSWVILHEQFVGVRIVAVILCDTGIALLAYMDGITGSPTLGGVVLAALAAAGYAVFKVMFRKVMGDPPVGQIAFIFTTLGFLNATLLWPVCVALYLTGTEVMPLDRLPWIILLIASVLLLVFHILTQFSSAVTYNMFVTLGLITAVPVSGALDVVLYSAQFAGMKLAGVILIAVGFFLVMFPENWPDYITRLLRNIILLGHNARWGRGPRNGSLTGQHPTVIDYRTGYIRSHLRSPSGRVR